MTGIIKSFAAAALFVGLLATSAQANTPVWGEGVVLASVSPSQATEMARPQFKRGKIVKFVTGAKPGSIIVRTKEHALYYVLGNGKAVKYRVATAKKGFEWSGTHAVSSKVKWPDWRPPTEMRQRRPELPAFMEGGPDNPLGARAIYIGGTIYRIHGTNEPSSIGKSASSGCIRMLNEDVSELFRFVKPGAKVIVI